MGAQLCLLFTLAFFCIVNKKAGGFPSLENSYCSCRRKLRATSSIVTDARMIRSSFSMVAPSPDLRDEGSTQAMLGYAEAGLRCIGAGVRLFGADAGVFPLWFSCGGEWMRLPWRMAGVLVLLPAVVFAQQKNKKHSDVSTAFLNAHSVYVGAIDGGDVTQPGLYPPDMQAISDVDDGVQAWKRYTLAPRKEQADLVFLVRKGRTVGAQGHGGISPGTAADPDGCREPWTAAGAAPGRWRRCRHGHRSGAKRRRAQGVPAHIRRQAGRARLESGDEGRPGRPRRAASAIAARCCGTSRCEKQQSAQKP